VHKLSYLKTLYEKWGERETAEMGSGLHSDSHAFVYGRDPGVTAKSQLSHMLWMLEYPDQALTQSQEALALAQELRHAQSTAYALYFAVSLNSYRREVHAV